MYSPDYYVDERLDASSVVSTKTCSNSVRVSLNRWSPLQFYPPSERNWNPTKKKETLRCDVSSCGYHSVLCFRPIHNVFLFTCLLQHRLLLVFQCVSNSLFARHFVLNVKTVSVSTTNVGCFVRLRRLQSGSIRADPSPLVRR